MVEGFSDVLLSFVNVSVVDHKTSSPVEELGVLNELGLNASCIFNGLNYLVKAN